VSVSRPTSETLFSPTLLQKFSEYPSNLQSYNSVSSPVPPSKQAFLVPGHPKPESRSDGTRGSQRMAAEQDLQGLDDEHDEHDELALD